MKPKRPKLQSLPLEPLPPPRGRLPRHGEGFWRQAMRDCENSGLSASMFCQQSGLAKATFFKWRKVLRERPPVPACCPPSAVGGFLQIAQTSNPALQGTAPAGQRMDAPATRVEDSLSLSLGGMDIKLGGQYAERVMRILTQRLGAGAFR